MPNEVLGRICDYAATTAAVPRTIGLTVLGASVSAGQWLFDAFSRLVTTVQPDERRPRHNESAVREQVRAAARAARAAGVFREGKSRR